MGWFRADRGFRDPYVLVFCGVVSLPAPGVHGYDRNKNTHVQLESSRPSIIVLCSPCGKKETKGVVERTTNYSKF